MPLFNVVIKNELTKSESDLIKEYWAHYGHENMAFKYAMLALKIKADNMGVKDLKSFIATNSYVFFVGKKGICIDCQMPLTALDRTNVKRLISQDKKSRICDQCSLINSEKYLKPYLDHLRILVENNINIIHLSEYDSLSYIEKMYIYLILNMCKINETGEIKEAEWEKFINNEFGEENYVIKSLYNKKFTFRVASGDFLHNTVESINNTIENIKYNKGIIAQEIINEFKAIQRRLPVKGIYLKLPNNFNCYKFFENFALKQIIEKTIYEEDVYEIEFWLNSVAISKLRYLTERARNKYENIGIEYNIELDSLYRLILNNLSIHECNYLINRAMYISSREISYANSKNSNLKYISRDKIYYYILKRTFDTYLKKGMDHKYEEDISQILNSSCIEIFFNSYIAINNIKWNYYKLRDIQTIIINSLKLIPHVDYQD